MSRIPALLRASLVPLLAFLTLLMGAGGAGAQGTAIHLLLNGSQTFNGIDDELDYGTSSNSLFADSFTLFMSLSYDPQSGTFEIFSNRSAGTAGIRIADEPHSVDPDRRLLVAQVHLPLALLANLSWSYPDDESVDVDLVFEVERSGSAPFYDWDSTLSVDGVIVDSFQSTWPIVAPSPNNLYLGRNVDGTVFWEGTAADIYVFTGVAP